MQLKRPKVRNRRINTRPSAEYVVLSEDSHSWAISYADFLMVLLSFFIVFFSIDDKNRENFIIQLVAGMAQKENQAPAVPKEKDAMSELNQKTIMSLDEQFKAQLRGIAQVEKDRDTVLIHFPDDIYDVGRVNLSPVQKEAVVEILNRLKPYMDRLVIGFIGHADSTPVKSHKGKILKTNFDVSVLRASTALVFGVQMGLPSERMYATGSGEQVRRSRSLSIIIKAGTVPDL